MRVCGNCKHMFKGRRGYRCARFPPQWAAGNSHGYDNGDWAFPRVTLEDTTCGEHQYENEITQVSSLY